MSLDALLSEDTMDVLQPSPAKDSSGGSTRLPYTILYANVACRWESLTAAQQLVFSSPTEIITHRIFTLQEGIANGHYLHNADGTLVRVTGINLNKGIGGIDDYFEILGIQVVVKTVRAGPVGPGGTTPITTGGGGGTTTSGLTGTFGA